MRARLTQTLPLLWISFCFTLHAGQPIGTTFSYRGSLSAGGMPAAGTFDLRFTLFDQSTNGLQVAAAVTNSAVFMNHGLFNVSLDFGAGAFNGERRWLEIGVRTNGSLADFETLTPRQELAPQPYALYAANAGSATVARDLAQGTFAGPFSLTNASNVFTGNGSGLSGVNASTLGGFGAGGFWHTSGNSGTSAGPNFLGTLDNQPLELKVDGARVLRFEPGSGGAPNLIGGASQNYVADGVSGATIAGGGASSLGESNSIAENFGTIGGGTGNSVEAGQVYATIAGGLSNLLPYYEMQYVPTTNSTIGGGYSNV
ncbi:MAG TPA: hypothetical protein VHI52_06295, partial [Verrucomicrobiae bacterium]|nr:hypothetical protein [Verrucomicrobiae bacterium]